MIIYLASGETHSVLFKRNKTDAFLLSYYDLAISPIPFRKWTWGVLLQRLKGVPIDKVVVDNTIYKGLK